jgi:hypothetical protein
MMAWTPGVARRAACRWLLGIGLALAGVGLGTVQAGETEVREFAVHVDGKPSGRAIMTIQHHEDGTTVANCETNVEVRVAFIKYRYSYTGREVWKDGRLQQFSSQCNDDGKQFQVTGVTESQGLRFRVNGQERTMPADSWLSSYWHLPEKSRHGALAIVDADNGRPLQGRLQHIATVQMTVAGQPQHVNHYRLTGSVQVELWYDGNERLVRQEWVEDGHRTLLELVHIRR